jgi:hypothetical protein
MPTGSSVAVRFWPDVSTENGAKNAVHAGAAALAWLSASYLIGLFFVILTNRGLYATFDDDLDRYSTIAVDLVLACLAALLTLLMWRRRSFVIAMIGLVWVLIEVGAKFVLAPGKGLVLSALMLLCVINGVRGTLAIRAGRAGSPSKKADEWSAADNELFKRLLEKPR